MKCDCENVSHFEPKIHGGGHPYGAETQRTVPVKTDWGTFRLCADCVAAKHYA